MSTGRYEVALYHVLERKGWERMLVCCVAFEKVDNILFIYVKHHQACKRKSESQEAGAEADTALLSADY